MIDQKKINTFITDSLKSVTGCEVIKSNTTAKAPSYPFISFSITRTATAKGTYQSGDRIPLEQTWSMTVQSDDDNEALEIAMRAKDWLEHAGRMDLNSNNIVVKSVSDIDSRDNLLSIEYEYRKGFDMVLSLMSVVEDKLLEPHKNDTINEFNIIKE